MRVGPGHIVVSSLVRGIGATVVREKYGRRAEFAERQLANCRCAKANHCRVGCQLCLPTKLGHTNLFSSFLIISEIALAIQLDPKRKPALEADPATSVAPPGWPRARATPSLVEVYRTVAAAGRPLLQAGWNSPLDRVRDRHRRLRFGRSYRIGDRSEPAIPYSHHHRN